MRSNNPYIWMVLITMTASACREAPPFQLDPKDKLIEITAFSEGVLIPATYQWIDCRQESNYLDGHIPGAINIWRDEMADEESMMLSRAEIEAILSAKGVRGDATLILYDDHGSSEAARLWWVMHYCGFDQTHILNGGFGTWKSMGFPIEAGTRTHPASAFRFSAPENKDLSANLDYVVARVGRPGVKIIDSRTQEEFDGSSLKKGAHHTGAIPGSIHIDFMDAVSPVPADDKRILPADQLKSLFEQRGIFPGDTIITYCHSGARSAHTTFILTQLLGYEHVRNYDGSWIEWSRTFH